MLAREEPMSEDKPYTIVAGLDLSEVGDRAFEGALEAAAAHKNAALHVVHVTVQEGDDKVRIEEPGLKKQVLTPQEASTYVRKYVETLIRAYSVDHQIPLERVTTHVKLGKPADEMLKLAEELSADEIMVGTHGRTGVRKLLMGSVAEEIFERADCVVAIVRPKKYGTEIEPEMTDAEKKVYEKFHRNMHGERHIYHYGRGSGPSSIVGRM